MDKTHAKYKHANASNGLLIVNSKRYPFFSRKTHEDSLRVGFALFVRLIPTDNRLMDAGSTRSYFTAHYESTNTDKSEARGLKTRIEKHARIIMQCTKTFDQKWRFPLFLDSIHSTIICKKNK